MQDSAFVRSNIADSLGYVQKKKKRVLTSEISQRTQKDARRRKSVAISQEGRN